MDLKQLKAKYSGQTIPEWELAAHGLKSGETGAEPARNRGRPPKAKPEAEPAPDEDGD